MEGRQAPDWWSRQPWRSLWSPSSPNSPPTLSLTLIFLASPSLSASGSAGCTHPLVAYRLRSPPDRCAPLLPSTSSCSVPGHSDLSSPHTSHRANPATHRVSLSLSSHPAPSIPFHAQTSKRLSTHRLATRPTPQASIRPCLCQNTLVTHAGLSSAPLTLVVTPTLWSWVDKRF